MPFIAADGSPLETVDLRQVAKRSFQLLQGFTYREPGTAVSIPVPPHDTSQPAVGDNATDLASVPPLLWGLVASYGLHTRAALMHDKLCVDAKSVRPPRAAFGVRWEADRLFRVALTESRVPWLRRWLMWAAVSVGRYFSHARPLGILLAGHLLLSVLGVFVAPFFLGGWWLLIALLGPLVLSLGWGRDAPVVAIGCVAVPLVTPLCIVGLITAGLVALPSWVYERLFERGVPVPSSPGRQETF